MPDLKTRRAGGGIRDLSFLFLLHLLLSPRGLDVCEVDKLGLLFRTTI